MLMQQRVRQYPSSMRVLLGTFYSVSRIVRQETARSIVSVRFATLTPTPTTTESARGVATASSKCSIAALVCVATAFLPWCCRNHQSGEEVAEFSVALSHCVWCLDEAHTAGQLLGQAAQRDHMT